LDDLAELSSCPTFFQQLVNKSSDVRITVVDGEYHAVELIAKDADGTQRCDIRRNNMADVEYREITLPTAIHEKVSRMMSHYNLRFAAIDMVVATTGEWYFLEVNPNGQWAWLDLDGNSNIAGSFVKAFSSELPSSGGVKS